MTAGNPRRGRLATRISVVITLVVTFATLFTAAGLGMARSGAADAAGTGGAAGARASEQSAAAMRAAAVPLSLRQAIAGTYTVPGVPVRMPWPAGGQAAVEVEGLGLLGASGPLDSPVPIASIAKTMTAFLILQDHPLAPGQAGPEITVSPAQAAVYEKEAATTSDSLAPVEAGEQLSERDALYALMLASADNIAGILAQWDAGSIPAFLARMNATAAKLGMAHTVFTDPSGLAASTTSTAQDLLTLGAAAMHMADFRQIVATPEAFVPVAGYIRNYDRLLGVDGVIGIKTGSTDAAGSCLLFAATVTLDGQTETVVGAVLGQRLGGYGDELGPVMAAARKLVLGAEAALAPAVVAEAGTTVAVVQRGAVRAGRLTVAAPLVTIGWPGLVLQVSVIGPPRAASIEVDSGAGASPLVTEPLLPG